MPKGSQNNLILRIKRWVLLNTRILKYGVVGFAGIAVNLATMALLLTLGFRRGWTPSAFASLISTSGNFILHNWWTFADRQHQGLRLVRGFLSFALISAMSVSITTVFYVAFTRMAAHLTIANAHFQRLGIPLTCQFAAILLAASTSYLLNGAFTWPRAHSKASVDLTPVEEDLAPVEEI